MSVTYENPMFSKIIVCPDLLSLDNVLTVCVAMVINPNAKVERREATEEDYDNPDILILGIGRFEPVKNNFEQQFGFSNPRKADSIFSRFCKYVHLSFYGVSLDSVLTKYSWYELVKMEANNALPTNCFSQLPIIAYILYLFSQNPNQTVLCAIGRFIVDQANDYMANSISLPNVSKMVEVCPGFRGIAVLDVIDKYPVKEWLEKEGYLIKFTLSHAKGKQAWKIVRCCSSDQLDFLIIFTSKDVDTVKEHGGVCYTKELLCLPEVLRLIYSAIPEHDRLPFKPVAITSLD